MHSRRASDAFAPTDPVAGLVFRPLRAATIAETRNNQLQLLWHCKPIITDLTYKLFFWGDIFLTSPAMVSSVALIDAAVGGAMADSVLNEVFIQYIEPSSNDPVSSTKCTSQILNEPWSAHVTQSDVERMIDTLLLQTGEPMISAPDNGFPNFAAVFVLPPGTVLEEHRSKMGRSDGPNLNSLDGLGGFHDFYVSTVPGTPTIYYAAVVWSDGPNGAAKPGWDPWMNVSATIYHELAEIRTDADYSAPAPAKKGWYVDLPGLQGGQEIGDLVIDYYAPYPQNAMQVVPLDAGGTAPIQYLWSNALFGPYIPSGAPIPPGPFPPP